MQNEVKPIAKFHESVSQIYPAELYACNAEAAIGGIPCKDKKLYGIATFVFEPAVGHSIPYRKIKEEAEKNQWPIEAALSNLDEKVKLQAMLLFVDDMIRNGRGRVISEKFIQNPDDEIHAVVQLCRGSVEKKYCIPDLIQSLVQSKAITFDPKNSSSFCRVEKVEEGKAENTVTLLKLTDRQGRVMKLDIRNGWSEKSFSEEAYKTAQIVLNFTTCAVINSPGEYKHTGKVVIARRMINLRQPKGGPMRFMKSEGTQSVDNYFKSHFDQIFTEENIKAVIKATKFFASKNPEKENRNLTESDFVRNALLVKGEGVLDIENSDHQTFVIE